MEAARVGGSMIEGPKEEEGGSASKESKESKPLFESNREGLERKSVDFFSPDFDPQLAWLDSTVVPNPTPFKYPRCL